MDIVSISSILSSLSSAAAADNDVSQLPKHSTDSWELQLEVLESVLVEMGLPFPLCRLHSR